MVLLLKNGEEILLYLEFLLRHMMVFLLSISTFVIPKLLGGGQYMLIGNLIESQFISVGDWNFGSAISLILAVLILIFMSLMKKMDKDE